MLLDRIRSAKDFTENDRAIATYVQDNLGKLPSLSAEELAEGSFTSKAAVVRFCKRLGLTGFNEFRSQIAIELNDTYRIDRLLKDEPLSETSSYEDIVHTIPAIYEAAVTKTRLSLDDATMQRAIEHLRAADKVDFYGLGISNTVAQTAAFKFLAIGKEAASFDGINQHYVQSLRRGKFKTASVVISFTGSNPTMISIARTLRAKGLYVLGIGGPIHEDLKRSCSDFVEVYNRSHLLSLEAIDAFTATTYVIDVLFASLLVSDYQANLSSSISIYRDWWKEPEGPSGC